MNVASVGLCERLHDLTAWDYDDAAHYCHWKGIVLWGRKPDGIPAYDLGYLLRRLPRTSVIAKSDRREMYAAWVSDCADPADALRNPSFTEALTPEDAACRLAIKLLEQGILSTVSGGPDV